MVSLIPATGINLPVNTSGNDVMMNKEDNIRDTLESIVGKDSLWIREHCSGRYYEVAPAAVEAIQAVLKFANRENIAVFHGNDSHFPSSKCISNGYVIVLVLSKMKKIIEVNEASRYVIVEPGVTHPELTGYLNAHCPSLQHCLISGSPGSTVLDTALECGTNSLSTLYGNTEDMVQGLEVVLPSGSISKIGSCSVSPLWFSNGALPDLRGLFLNGHGTTGIVTKLSLRLFPTFDFNDLVIYTLKNPEMIPEVIERATHPEMADLISIIGKEFPSYLRGVIIIALRLSGNDKKILDLKREVFKDLLKNNKAIMYKEHLPEEMRRAIFMKPGDPECRDQENVDSFDCMIPLETIPFVWQQGIQLIHGHHFNYMFDFTVEDHGHRISGKLTYFFPGDEGNRCLESESLQRELQRMVLDSGGIPLDLYAREQKYIIDKMDPVTEELTNRIFNVMDAEKILNPFIWKIYKNKERN